MRLIVGLFGLVLIAGCAQAASGDEAELPGQATLGSEVRPVTLRLACDAAGLGLSAVLTVPRFADLAPRFDFDAFEGPGGTGKPLTAIRVSGSGGVRSVVAAASGAVAADPATSFSLTVAGARRGEDPLRGIASGLTEHGARVTWTQTSPRKGDTPLTATFPVEDPAPLKTALGPCLPR